jgi:hypothetical protein
MNELKRLQKTPGWTSFQAFSRWVTGKKLSDKKLEQMVKTHVNLEDYKGNPRDQILGHFKKLNQQTGFSKAL